MHQLLRQAHWHNRTSISYFDHLLNHCLSLKSSNSVKIIHAQLLKVGYLGSNTFLGNRCLDVYFRIGSASSSLKVFDDIHDKNVISWNICLNGLLKSGLFKEARSLFDEMPERDVVSWNSMISGCSSSGFIDHALNLFVDMQNAGVRPSEFTFSILTSCVTCADYGKQIHGCVIRRSGSLSSLVLCNSLIDMYGTLGLVDYAFGVFKTMEELDIITWNSLISCGYKSGSLEFGLKQFCLMRSMECPPDEYTMSALVTICSDLLDLVKGKQIYAFCVKMGFLCNAIVSSALVDLFSKCNRLEDSIRLFEELNQWDLELCDSMIASYTRFGFAEDALNLFILTLKKNLKPTAFTISSILSVVTVITLVNGTQVHCLTVKSGFESDLIVANSLVEMYNKTGLVDSAMKIFVNMHTKDLICWNTMIVGLTRNGRLVEALSLFVELLKEGPLADRITFLFVLLGCNYGCLVDEGIAIFSLMENHGVPSDDEHYACIVDLLCHSGYVKEAVEFTEAIPFEPRSIIWRSILRASANHGDLELTERVAKRMIELGSESKLPYIILAQAYKMAGRWEDVVRITNAATQKGIKEIMGCSSITIENHVHSFKADQLRYQGGQEVYLLLELLNSEMDNEDNFCMQYEKADSNTIWDL